MEEVVINCTKLTVPMLAKLNSLLDNDVHRVQMNIRPTASSDTETPLPWDAWIEIRDDKNGVEQLCVEGHAGASGFGYCEVVVPLAEARMYEVVVEQYNPLFKIPAWVHALADE